MASTASMPAYMLSGVPVHQPSHLEGDPSLATEILPGPPSLVSAQQSVLKRDPRKPSMAFSYLPPSDPGSTYSGIMHGTLIGHEHDASRLKRSKAATGRAQRASARNQNGAASTFDPPVDSEAASASNSRPIPIDLEPYTMVLDDEPSISRSNSLHNLQEGPSASIASRPRRRDKGKGKEVESPVVKVKEEPKLISLHTPEPLPSNLLNNDDHCSSCRSYGALVYCDGCPKAFHLWCLDPPMESVDEGDSRWFCPQCTIRKHPPRKPPPSLLSPVIHQLDISFPVEFQLPEDLRTFFKDVSTGPKGSYVEDHGNKLLRLNRLGQQEDRDSHRLRDKNGAPVLCFRCGTSALPEGVAAAAPAAKRARRTSTIAKVAAYEAWKNIISCDYCPLHWHLDCLDPPVYDLPPSGKKWMCPNHADKILPPKRRIPKQNVPPIEITKPNQFNNGNIEIIHPEIQRLPQIVPKVAVDEVLINGRRYRVPERVVILDFWSKLNKAENHPEKELKLASGMSSPLTSLSSLDDDDERMLPEFPSLHHDTEDLKVAQLLCSLQSKMNITAPPPIPGMANGIQNKVIETPAQTEPNQSLPIQSRVVKLPKVAAPAKPKRTASKASAANGSTRAPRKASNAVSAPPKLNISTTAKRRKAVQSTNPGPSTRELRSRSKNNAAESSLTSISSRSSMKRADDSGRDSLLFDGPMSAPALPPSSFGKSRSFHVKVEEIESSYPLGSSSTLEAGPSSHTPAKRRYVTLARTRARQSPLLPAQQVTRKELVITKPETKEKRGRKRKERDDELPNTDGRDLVEVAEKLDAEKKDKKPRRGGKKAVRTPSRPGPLTSAVPSVVASASAPVTPSLKIRLPRLSNIAIPTTNSDTTTRL